MAQRKPLPTSGPTSLSAGGWQIPFNKVQSKGLELQNLVHAISTGELAGNGPFARRCETWLVEHTHAKHALLTGSCTAALEMSALLCELQPGDEVLMPSYTFVTTASAFAQRGAVPVFVDIRPDTLNLDERLLEETITDRTRVIVPVHYGGVACNMDPILALADQHNLRVVEDAAQAILAYYYDRPLGSLGDLGAMSFHVTKNVVSGEGGALLINDSGLRDRAEILQEKGTNRAQFLEGRVDKYSWVDLGSSFLMGELGAAFLQGQMQWAVAMRDERLSVWRLYHELLAPMEDAELLRRPIIPGYAHHNAHLYYVLLAPTYDRSRVLADMHLKGIEAVFHYVPLHESPAGRRFGRAGTPLTNTRDLSARLIRLPLWSGMPSDTVERVVTALRQSLLHTGRTASNPPTLS